MCKTYYQKNRYAVLSKAKKYYKNNKGLLKECVKNRYNSLTEYKKQKLKEYQKEYQTKYQKSIKNEQKINIDHYQKMKKI